jgi:hypothetical protein
LLQTNTCHCEICQTTFNSFIFAEKANENAVQQKQEATQANHHFQCHTFAKRSNSITGTRAGPETGTVHPKWVVDC